VKITGVETYPVWGGQRNLLFVLVDTDEGIYGVGEAGLTGRELAVIGAIEHFEPLLVGENPFRIEHLWQLLFRGGFFPARHAISAAISAVDIALWDIKGKALDVPVYELLGGRARDRVVCYPHNAEAGMDTSALVESCLETKEEGWRFVRWGLPQEGEIFRPYRSVLAAVEQLGAVRDAVGQEVYGPTLSRTPCVLRTLGPTRCCGCALTCPWPPGSSSAPSGSSGSSWRRSG
jgi:L-alanine-DL-glutamate epimerase-like enolase superfamily enzyme